MLSSKAPSETVRMTDATEEYRVRIGLSIYGSLRSKKKSSPSHRFGFSSRKMLGGGWLEGLSINHDSFSYKLKAYSKNRATAIFHQLTSVGHLTPLDSKCHYEG